MKKAKLFHVLFYFICVFILTVSVSLASPPERLNYQGTLTDNNGNRITGSVSMIFNIYDQQGSLIWGPETIASVQVNDGLFSVVLGETVSISSSLFSSGSRYISVTVNGEPMSPRQLINSVPYALNGVPSGVITMWSGAVNNIPAGWALCDGSNGTPNLRDRFIVGAGGGYGVGATGGTTSINLAHSHTVNDHTHTFNHLHYDDHTHSGTTSEQISDRITVDHGTSQAADDTHSHTFGTTSKSQQGYGAYTYDINQTYGYAPTTSGASDRGTDSRLNGAQDIRPPYYALAFIMKL